MANKRIDILDDAVKCAAVNGLEKLTFQMVSAQTGLRPNAIVWYFPTIKELKQAVVEHAVDTRNLGVVAQAAVLGYEVPSAVALQAIDFIAERFS